MARKTKTKQLFLKYFLDKYRNIYMNSVYPCRSKKQDWYWAWFVFTSDFDQTGIGWKRREFFLRYQIINLKGSQKRAKMVSVRSRVSLKTISTKDKDSYKSLFQKKIQGKQINQVHIYCTNFQC